MPCISCKDNIIKDEIKVDQWLTREEVRQLCEPCYKNMINNNISKIKKSTLMDKVLNGLNTTMKIIEVVFIGHDKQTFNIGGKTFYPYQPEYYFENELPITLVALKAHTMLKVNVIEGDRKPTSEEAKLKGAKLVNKKGIKWVGASPKMVNEFGSFKRDELVLVDESTINSLKARNGFQVVE